MVFWTREVNNNFWRRLVISVMWHFSVADSERRMLPLNVHLLATLVTVAEVEPVLTSIIVDWITSITSSNKPGFQHISCTGHCTCAQKFDTDPILWTLLTWFPNSRYYNCNCCNRFDRSKMTTEIKGILWKPCLHRSSAIVIVRSWRSRLLRGTISIRSLG